MITTHSNRTIVLIHILLKQPSCSNIVYGETNTSYKHTNKVRYGVTRLLLSWHQQHHCFFLIIFGKIVNKQFLNFFHEVINLRKSLTYICKLVTIVNYSFSIHLRILGNKTKFHQ